MTTAERLRAIHRALLAALDGPGLAQLAALYLGRPLEHITQGGDLEHKITDLLQWAEAQGQMAPLLAGAIALNPTSPELQRLLAETRTALLWPTMDDFRTPPSNNGGGSLPRLERKIDELTAAVNNLATRVSVLEYQVKHAPGLWLIAFLVAVIFVAAAAYVWGSSRG